MAFRPISNKAVLVAIIAVCASFHFCSAQDAGEMIVPIDTLTDYEIYSGLFYENRSFEVSEDLKPLERYLTFLVNSVNSQIQRRKDVEPIDFDVLTSEDISNLILNLPLSAHKNYFANKFEIWEQYQFKELFWKIDKIQQIKRRLWVKGDADTRLKMFKMDVEEALDFYRRSEYSTVVHIFRHIIDFYGYSNIDDLIYFMSEAEYILGNDVAAAAGYKDIVQNFPQSDFYEYSLYRLISLACALNNCEDVHEYYTLFKLRFDRVKTDKKGIESPGWTYNPDVIFFIEASVLFQQGEYEKSLRVYDLVPDSSPYYGRSVYVSAHCLMRLDRTEEALDMLADILNDEVFVYDDIWYETAILIGDIKISQNLPNVAWGFYNLLVDESELYPRALVGKGLIRYQRAEYDTALALADEVIENYSINNYIYIARCLRAACLRKLDRVPEATEEYSIILQQSMKKINLVNFLTERLKTTFLLNRLIGWEEEVIEAGDADMLTRYWQLRSNVETLVTRAYYTEYIEVEPGFADYLDERLNLIDLMDRVGELGTEVELLDLGGFKFRYAVLSKKMQNIEKKLWASGIGQLKEIPYYYWNESERFEIEVLDSLYDATLQEITRIEDQLIFIARALRIEGDNIASEQRAEMLQTAYDVRQWRENLDMKVSRNIYITNPVPELDLARWSHVAFHKTMIPGPDFDNLKDDKKRADEIDKYLKALDEITFKLGISVSE